MPKRKTTALAAFSAEELTALARCYPTIRRRLAERELGDVLHRSVRRLPAARSRTGRLRVLRRLDAARLLWIHISYAGNLNVHARSAPDVGDESFMTMVRWPFTAWCKPRGRYYPDPVPEPGALLRPRHKTAAPTGTRLNSS